MFDRSRQADAFTFYFHGMPGSPSELELFPSNATANWHAPDRGALPPNLSVQQRFDALAELIERRTQDGPIRLVGFSLGTYVALEVACRLSHVELNLVLVSAAAPLSAGDFLDRMAGKAVFSLAARCPAAFAALVGAQALAARLMPQQLVPILFASAQGADMALPDDPKFLSTMARVLRESVMFGRTNYRIEVDSYVQDWSGILPTIKHPVTLWHGEADNWSPPEMALALAKRLPNVVECKLLPDLSHYSTLRAAIGGLT